MCFDVEKDEDKLVDEEVEEEQLVDYGSKPEFYETGEKPLTYIIPRSETEGDVVELDKTKWFEKVADSVEINPLFQNIQNPSTKGGDKKIVSWKYSLELKLFMIKRRGGEILYISNRKHFKTFRGGT